MSRNTQTLLRKAHELGFESLAYAAVSRYKLASHATTTIVQEGVGLVRAILQSPQLAHMRRALARDQVFKKLVEECALERVQSEMQNIAQNPHLRLPGTTVGSDLLDNFSFRAIDEEHARSAPFLRTVLKAASGNSDTHWASPDEDGNEDMDVDFEDNIRFRAEKLHHVR